LILIYGYVPIDNFYRQKCNTTFSRGSFSYSQFCFDSFQIEMKLSIDPGCSGEILTSWELHSRSPSRLNFNNADFWKNTWWILEIRTKRAGVNFYLNSSLTINTKKGRGITLILEKIFLTSSSSTFPPLIMFIQMCVFSSCNDEILNIASFSKRIYLAETVK